MSHDDLRPDGEREPAVKNGYGLTDEEMSRLQRAKKRNLVVAIVGGLILAVMGFLAGQNIGSDGASVMLEVTNARSL
ncbi:hypothetical protein [Trueperella pyogenes]|uniref:Uncharacterized protein n=1 Tax=Trueperella pyogenes TaxID=1661 RepID=A0A380M9K5_9ACTO|nr:hypothetical protein [Trueperella pyogenes]AJC70606.1 hypothetical protein X956_06475 [Trueperella pyogenes TP8]ALD74377.1 hypothetical protein AN946_08785 [Trueperella pyogenes]AWG04790.1 hypothetical protein DC090_10375 [Trueperella pyogenes]AWG15616.1 hypothetical protein DDE06_01520 [Trueperella pyogenes]AZR04502.1 hypothetical protein EBQ11_04125 [Trueperella pyogenes]